MDVNISTNSIDRNRWQDSYAITFRHARHVDYSIDGINLAVVNNKPTFNPRSLFKEIDQQPDHMSWFVNYPHPARQFFTLQNVSTGTYLARRPNSLMVTLVGDAESGGDNALWRITPASAQGDIIIFNKSEAGHYALNVVQEALGNAGETISLVRPRDNYNADIYLGLTNRYMNLLLTAQDIQANNCLLRLPNGFAVDTLFVPTPDYNKEEPTIRRFKIAIAGNTPEQQHEFANRLHFDPASADNEDHAAILDSLNNQISRLKVVQKFNLDIDHVRREIYAQLSSLYKNSGDWPYQGIAWIPLGPGEPAIFAQTENGDLRCRSDVELGGKFLKIQIIAAKPVDAVHYFAILVKKTVGNTVSYLLVDPSDSESNEPV